MSEEPKKRAPRCTPANGRCPDCETPLGNWGAESDGDGGIYDVLGCGECGLAQFQRHATYCLCAECAEGVNKMHRIEAD